MTLIEVPRPWWRKKSFLIGAAVFLTVGLAGGAVTWVGQAARSCGDGVERRGDFKECVGVTDGGVVFAPELADVQHRIHEENLTVERSGKPYVTIAYFVPMTVVNQPTIPIEWVRHQLQGAYLAQWRANYDSTAGNLPLIRILLANPGGQMAFWEPVVDELARRREAPDHLVAVAGIGLSLENARTAMRRLSELQIAIVGSTITADDLVDIPGLLRVAPTNSGQAKAAASYIKSTARTALLVQDSSGDDLYPKALATAFEESFPDQDHRFVGQPELYDASLPGVDNTFLQMMPNICISKPDVVYFAGRGLHLAHFVKQLAGRRCKEHPITVLTGDALSVVQFGEGDVGRATESGVRIVFTTLAHADAWANAPGAFQQQSVKVFTDRVCTVCYPGLFPTDSLEDGSAIMAHDAVLTAVRGIRLAAGDQGARVSPRDVLQVKNRLHDAHAVPGASGWLSFDERGTPQNKSVPIMQLQPDGTSKFIHLSTA